MKNGDWVLASEKLPIFAGWYHCEMKDGTIARIPFVSFLSGKLGWVLPDPTQVIKWQTK